jgi:hypothetical protein
MRLPQKAAGVIPQPVAVETKDAASKAATEVDNAVKQVAPITQNAIVPAQETQKQNKIFVANQILKKLFLPGIVFCFYAFALNVSAKQSLPNMAEKNFSHNLRPAFI